MKKSLDLQLILKINIPFNTLSQFLWKIKDLLPHQPKLVMMSLFFTINMFQPNKRIVNLVVDVTEKLPFKILLICTNTEKKNQKINGNKNNPNTNGQMLFKNSE